jgi:hypothetical protein
MQPAESCDRAWQQVTTLCDAAPNRQEHATCQPASRAATARHRRPPAESQPALPCVLACRGTYWITTNTYLLTERNGHGRWPEGVNPSRTGLLNYVTQLLGLHVMAQRKRDAARLGASRSSALELTPLEPFIGLPKRLQQRWEKESVALGYDLDEVAERVLYYMHCDQKDGALCARCAPARLLLVSAVCTQPWVAAAWSCVRRRSGYGAMHASPGAAHAPSTVRVQPWTCWHRAAACCLPDSLPPPHALQVLEALLRGAKARQGPPQNYVPMSLDVLNKLFTEWTQTGWVWAADGLAGCRVVVVGFCCGVPGQAGVCPPPCQR